MLSRTIVLLGIVSFASLSQNCDALKIHYPTDELPKELNHPRDIEALEVGYLNLDKVLAKLYEPDNLIGNMELCNGILESELKRPTLLKGVKWLNETVDLFLSLSRVAYDRCDYESYKSLAQNYRAVDGRSHELLGERGRAIDMIIYDYSLEHARECGPKYVQRFEIVSRKPATKVVASIVDEVLKGLDADSLLSGEDGDSSVVRYKPENVIEMSVSRLDVANHGFYTIMKNIEQLIKGKSSEEAQFYPRLLVEGSGRKQLQMPPGFEMNIFNKYLINPCEHYIELYRDIFAPARFDAMIRQEELYFPPRANNSILPGFSIELAGI